MYLWHCEQGMHVSWDTLSLALDFLMVLGSACTVLFAFFTAHTVPYSLLMNLSVILSTNLALRCAYAYAHICTLMSGAAAA